MHVEQERRGIEDAVVQEALEGMDVHVIERSRAFVIVMVLVKPNIEGTSVK
jgi:hypothetical protein